MIVALLLLIASGYWAARGLLREPSALSALSLGTALAWASFITLLNLALRMSIPFSEATWVAGLLVLGLGLTGILRSRPPRIPRTAVDSRDVAVLLVGFLPSSLIIMLHQLLGADTDNVMHYPLVALFMKGYFPHFNPYFPDLPLYGHYGRDLGLAGLLSFGPIGIGTAMILEAWVLHLATLINIYLLALRSGLGRQAGAMAACLAFFAVNAGFADGLVRSGLAEVNGNNNPVVYAFFFVILNLVILVIDRPSLVAIMLLGILLGAFDIVYETHFQIVLATLCMLAAALTLPATRHWLGATSPLPLALSIALAVLVMLASGGLTSRMILSEITPFSASPDAGSAYTSAASGVQQSVDVTFPKQPFLSLTHALDGRAVPLFSAEFLLGQGVGFWLLPFSILVLALKRRLIGIVCGMIALLSILLPASVDFGRFNGENLRYIFLSGLMAAVCLGMALGDVLSSLASSAGTRRRLYIWVGHGTLLTVLWLSATNFYTLFGYAQTVMRVAPQAFRVTETERLEYFCAEYSSGDAEATAYLATHGRRGDRLLSNYWAPYQRESVNMLNNSMVLIAESKIPMVGFNIRILRESGGIRSSVDGWSGRARAFWQTGDEEILRDLGADWLYIVPKWLSPASAQSLQRHRSTQEAFRADGGERVVYSVNQALMSPRPEPPRETVDGLIALPTSGLEGGALEKFIELGVLLRNGGHRSVKGRVYLYYRIYDRTAGAFYDERDAVGTVHVLDIPPGKDRLIRVPFVFPYNDGDYEVTLFARAHEGDVRLGSFQFTLQPVAPLISPQAG